MSYDPAATKKRLVEAARAELENNGFDQATGLAIHKRAEVSSGSWRHTFRNGKLDAAAVIYPQLHAEIWDPVLESLGNPTSGPDPRPIKRALDELLKQVTCNRGRARLLFDLQIVLVRPGYEGAVADRERTVRCFVSTWVAVVAGTGTPSAISDLSFGLVFGPAIDLCRLWAFSHLTDIPNNAARFLAAAAAEGLRSRSLPRAHQARTHNPSGGGAALQQVSLFGADTASLNEAMDPPTVRGKVLGKA